MNCMNHKDIEANYACRCCGQPLCLECTVQLRDGTYCRECLERNISNNPSAQKFGFPRRKSKFLTFCFGFIPGAGHMYLGLINKGFSLMCFYFGALFSIIILGNALYIHWLDILIAPLSILCGFYSLFDALAAVNDLNSGRLVIDESILSGDLRLDNFWENTVMRNKVFGNVLIVIGCVGLFNLFMRSVNNFIARLFSGVLPFPIQNIIMPIILIAAGIYLLRKGREEQI